MNVRFTPEAEADLVQARAWYSRRRLGLPREFARAVDERVRTISELPEAWPVVLPPVRRALLKRFPYSLYFILREDVIVVIACMHTARDPDVWQIRSVP